MKTQTKLMIAALVAIAMMWLNILSHPLGLSEGVQLVLVAGTFIPLWLIFVLTKRLKCEKADEVAAGVLSPEEIDNAQRKGKKRLIIVWICMVPFSMSCPFWLPSITGITLGRKGDCLISVVGILLVSLVFWIQLKKPNQALSPLARKAGRGSA